MKKLLLSSLSLFAMANSYAQFNTVWPNNLTATSNVNNSTSAGYVGLGIKSTPTSTNLPNFNFQVHGTTDYIITTPYEMGGGGGLTVNYGKTARIGLTNTTTGAGSADGGLIRMSGNNFVISNQEDLGNMTLSSSGVMTISGGGTRLIMVGNKSYFGSSNANFTIAHGLLNVQSNSSDNGLFIKTLGSGKYGLSVKVAADTDNAILVYGSSATTRTFQVKGNGKVWATEINVMLASTPFPDYVFESNYYLKPLHEVESHIKTFGRLPNMPSANQVAQEGLNLGETSFVLVEKIEELTLYLIEQQKVIDALNAKVSKLEQNQNK